MKPVALSTSCISKGCRDGESLLAAVRRLRVDALELEYRIPASVFRQMRGPLLRGGPAVCSVHNFFALPDAVAPGGAGGDFFLLSSPDEDERRPAVHWTRHTLQTAADLGAQAVVLHCGRVEMKSRAGSLYDGYRSRGALGAEARGLLADRMEEREHRKPPHLKALCRSIEELLPAAESLRVRLGLENRYHYHELPGMEEFRRIFERYPSSCLGYWHDTGHAHAQECLGILKPGEALGAFADRLVGVHVHDAAGLDDHLPPGDGEIDLAAVARRMGPETLNVVELKPGTETADIRRGLSYWVGMGGWSETDGGDKVKG